ncbi:MAG: GNAT family N-acetyltransferase [Anaerolineae bacterium]
MRIKQVNLNSKADVNLFIDFPFKLYRTCRQWVPPMQGDMRLVLDPTRHPFYQHSEACFFLAESEGQVVGRVAVLNHKRFNSIRHESAAFLYYLDFIDNEQVSSMLLDAASDWAREHGLTKMLGPKGFLQADGHGILVEGYDYSPAMGIPYNYPYYEAHLLQFGFEKVTDYYSGFITREQGLPERYFIAADAVRARRGYIVHNFRNKAELREWIGRIGKIYRDAFAEHWEFCPPTDDEMRMIAERMLEIADPHLIKVVLKGDEIIGFVLAFPDVSAGMRKAHGKLYPLGWWHLWRAFRTTQWVDLNGVGILAPYQGTGANAVMYAELTRVLYEHQYQNAEFIQVEERNYKSLGETRALHVQWHKRHRVYQKSL